MNRPRVILRNSSFADLGMEHVKNTRRMFLNLGTLLAIVIVLVCLFKLARL